jgi:hypothetical protein
MVWQFWFDIYCCLPTSNCKCKGKNMVILNGLAFWTWQLPSGPSQIFCHTRVFPFARTEAPPLAVAGLCPSSPSSSSWCILFLVEVADSISVFQSRSRRDDVADSICVFESRQTNGGADSIWREDSLRRRKRRQTDQAAQRIDAGKPATSVCQSKSQLPNMPREASQMPSLLK